MVIHMMNSNIEFDPHYGCHKNLFEQSKVYSQWTCYLVQVINLYLRG